MVYDYVWWLKLFRNRSFCLWPRSLRICTGRGGQRTTWTRADRWHARRGSAWSSSPSTMTGSCWRRWSMIPAERMELWTKRVISNCRNVCKKESNWTLSLSINFLLYRWVTLSINWRFICVIEKLFFHLSERTFLRSSKQLSGANMKWGASPLRSALKSSRFQRMAKISSPFQSQAMTLVLMRKKFFLRFCLLTFAETQNRN